MTLELFALCDAATDYGGRLNLLGVFEGVAAPTAPIVKDRCSIAARIRFSKTETGQRMLAVRIADAEGRQPVPDMMAPLGVAIPAGRSSAAVNLVLNINGLTLPSFGLYEIRLMLDGAQIAMLPLMVAQVKERRSGRPSMEN